MQHVVSAAFERAVREFGTALATADLADHRQANRLARWWRRVHQEVVRRHTAEQRHLWPELCEEDAFAAATLSGLVDVQVDIEERLVAISLGVERLTRLMDGWEPVRRDTLDELGALDEDLRYRQVLQSAVTLPPLPTGLRSYGLPVVLHGTPHDQRERLLAEASAWARIACRLWWEPSYERLVRRCMPRASAAQACPPTVTVPMVN